MSTTGFTGIKFHLDVLDFALIFLRFHMFAGQMFKCIHFYNGASQTDCYCNIFITLLLTRGMLIISCGIIDGCCQASIKSGGQVNKDTYIVTEDFKIREVNI